MIIYEKSYRMFCSFILMITFATVFTGCGVDEKKTSEEKIEQSTQVNTEVKETAKSNEDKDIHGKALDNSISVSKEEMDKLIPVAKGAMLTEDEVKTLVKVLKQVHFDINKIENAKVLKDRVISSTGIYIKGGAIDKPLQFLYFVIEKNKRGLAVYFHRDNSEHLKSSKRYFLYEDGRIWGDMNDFSFTNDKYEKMFKYIATHPETLDIGNVNKIEFGNGDYEKAVDGIKKYGLFDMNQNQKLIFHIPTTFHGSSKVYGDGDKTEYRVYEFDIEGNFIRVLGN